MKVISFNANGIRSAARKGFYDWLKEENPDFVCIQETKAQTANLKESTLYFPEDYFCDYCEALKKGYSGVAIYARIPPNQITKALGNPICDNEGRYIQFDYDNLCVISLYMPSGTSGEIRQSVKYEFLSWFATHLQSLKEKGKNLIICGDYNMAHKEIDLKNWRGNQKNSGFLPEERAWLDSLFGHMGFIDAFRVVNQEAEQYTWWSNRGQAREKNVGWRIDYQVITPELTKHIKNVRIYRETFFSDHAPLIIEYQDVWPNDVMKGE